MPKRRKITDEDNWQSKEALLAQERVGIRPEEAVSWLLEFANLDLDNISAGFKYMLWLDIKAFCVPLLNRTEDGYNIEDRVRMEVDQYPPFTDLTDSEKQEDSFKIVTEIQIALRERLDSLFAANATSGIAEFPELTASFVLYRHRDNRIEKNVQSTVTDLFFLRTIELLLSMAERIRNCGNSSCQRPFVANKRQAYCSRKCSQQVRTARFRGKEDPEEVSKKRHEKYVKRQEKKLSGKVKVQRRKRKSSPK